MTSALLQGDLGVEAQKWLEKYVVVGPVGESALLMSGNDDSASNDVSRVCRSDGDELDRADGVPGQDGAGEVRVGAERFGDGDGAGLEGELGRGTGLINMALAGELKLPSRLGLPADFTILLLLGLALLKVAATAITRGSGGSGGLFTPSLAFGALVGGVGVHRAAWVVVALALLTGWLLVRPVPAPAVPEPLPAAAHPDDDSELPEAA